jgi:hypothetical protein
MTSANSTSALNNWGVYAAAVMRLKALAPYALIELILPGGSVMALLLWLYRRRKNGVGSDALSMRRRAAESLDGTFTFPSGRPRRQ